MTRRRPASAEICGLNDSLQTEFAWIITTGTPVPAVSIKAIDPWLVSIIWLDIPSPAESVRQKSTVPNVSVKPRGCALGYAVGAGMST